MGELDREEGSIGGSMTELLTDPRHFRSDLRQIETSIRKGWVIPDQLLEALPKVAGKIALNGKPRDQTAAMKVLLAMKEQNDKAKPIPQQIEHRHTHEIGPVTAETIEEHRAIRLARIASAVRK